MESKIVTTNVTSADLTAAQGGIGGSSDLITVECPIEYDVEMITADDLLNDSQIVVVQE